MSRQFSMMLNSKKVIVSVETEWDNDETNIRSITAAVENSDGSLEELELDTADPQRLSDDNGGSLPTEWDLVLALETGDCRDRDNIIPELLGPEHMRCLELYAISNEYLEQQHRVMAHENILRGLKDPDNYKEEETRIKANLQRAQYSLDKAQEDPERSKPAHYLTSSKWLRKLRAEVDKYLDDLGRLPDRRSNDLNRAQINVKEFTEDLEDIRQLLQIECVKSTAWNPQLPVRVINDFVLEEGVLSFQESPGTFLDWFQNIPLTLKHKLHSFLDIDLLDRLATGWEAQKARYMKLGYSIPRKV